MMRSMIEMAGEEKVLGQWQRLSECEEGRGRKCNIK